LASTGSTKYDGALFEGLRHAVHGLRAPFTYDGTLVPEQPVTLRFPDNTQVPVLCAKDAFEQERLLQSLVEPAREFSWNPHGCSFPVSR
jgi:hypothetical protein